MYKHNPIHIGEKGAPSNKISKHFSKHFLKPMMDILFDTRDMMLKRHSI